jgi:hypothetical protein
MLKSDGNTIECVLFEEYFKLCIKILYDFPLLRFEIFQRKPACKPPSCSWFIMHHACHNRRIEKF